jgi:hypothetical protein
MSTWAIRTLHSVRLPRDARGVGRARRRCHHARIARGLLIALMSSLVALGPAAAAPAPAGRDARAYPDVPLVPAQSARAFGDSVGVNVHLLFENASYGHFELVQARLRELGVRYIRDGLCASCPNQIPRLNRLAALGIRANIITADLRGGTAMMRENLAAIRTRLRTAVVSVEAPNEPDVEGFADWIGRTRAFQQELYFAVKGDPALRHLPVLGPAVVHHANRPALGDLSAHLDRGNMHPYPGGGTPLHNLEDERRRAVPISGSKPLVATEAGYHSDLATTSGHHPTSERASAIYMPRLALEGFRGGVERTYVYELADPWTESQRVAQGIPILQNSFGLLRADLSPKPSFLALRNLLRAADGGSAPVAAPGGLRLGLEGGPADLRRLLLRSADGSFALVLWREISVWDRIARRDLFPAPARVEVVVGQPVAVAQRFDPVESDAERARWLDPERIPVELAGAPVVLRLTPPGVPVQTRRRSGGLSLAATRKRQRLRRRIVVKVSCADPCARVSGRGKLVVRRKRRRVFELRPAAKPVRNGAAALRLKIPPEARRAAARALRRGRHVRARVTVKGWSAGTELGSARKWISLRRRR